MTSLTQPGLFASPGGPSTPGLTYVTNAVTAEEERALARFIGALDLKPFEWRGFTGNRRTVSFGWRYDFNGGGFQKAEPLPAELLHARASVCADLGEAPDAFEQCSVIEYAPGAGIGWHKDRPQFGKVAGLSLLAPARFRFRRQTLASGWERRAVLLEPRSAYLLEEETRHLWQHSIPALAALRYSITFRTLAP
jgi:alkylated DNA repair dioxygenase AlkB